jgi:hypothetical protein
LVEETVTLGVDASKVKTSVSKLSYTRLLVSPSYLNRTLVIAPQFVNKSEELKVASDQLGTKVSKDTSNALSLIKYETSVALDEEPEASTCVIEPVVKVAKLQ